MNRLILLDRDGVINFDSSEYIKGPSEWRPLPGALSAIAALRNAGYLVGLCSNQAGVARGKLTDRDLDAVHAKMCQALAAHGAGLDFAAYCRHHPDDNCGCRKPRPGMLLGAMKALRAKPERTWFVGDSITDVQAALAAGCQPALVRSPDSNSLGQDAPALDDVRVFENLATFARALLA